MAASEGQRDVFTRVGDTKWGRRGQREARGGLGEGGSLYGGPLWSLSLLRHNGELSVEWKHAERKAFICHCGVDRALTRLALLRRPDTVALETRGKRAERGVGVSLFVTLSGLFISSSSP